MARQQSCKIICVSMYNSALVLHKNVENMDNMRFLKNNKKS